MKLVFEHIDFTVVGHLQTVLEAEGIRTEIRNQGASGATGEVPFAQVYPELWVLNNGDEARAKEFVRNYRNEAAAAPVGPPRSGRFCRIRNMRATSFFHALRGSTSGGGTR